jgi:hypothetical protein
MPRPLKPHKMTIYKNKNFRIILSGTYYAVKYADGYTAAYFLTLAAAKKYIGKP